MVNDFSSSVAVAEGGLIEANDSVDAASSVGGETGKAMVRVETVVSEHFPEAIHAVKSALAVAAVGCLSDHKQPTTLVYVAPSSAGKSLALGFMMPEGDDDPLSAYFYRSDKFTEASFVTHRADLTEEQLAKIDLLPRLADKTLLTKELAPVFTGKRDELVGRFAVLTAILDGDGYVSDSGAQGRRGYEKPVNFSGSELRLPSRPNRCQSWLNLAPASSSLMRTGCRKASRR